VIVRCSSSEAGTLQADGSAGPLQRIAASRTIKYFDAILAGAWVLSPEWVLSSYTAGKWLPEADFELAGDPSGIGGPAAGRSHGPRLFDGLRLHFPPAGAAPAGAGGKKDGLTSAKSRHALDEAAPDVGKDDGGPRPEDLDRLARRGGAEVLSTIDTLPDAEADPSHLGPGAREATAAATLAAAAAAAPSGGRSRSSGGAAAKDMAAAEPCPWYRRPIAVVAAGGRASCSAASTAGWAVLSASWLLDCISLGEIATPAGEWLTANVAAPAPAASGRRTSRAKRRPSAAEANPPEEVPREAPAKRPRRASSRQVEAQAPSAAGGPKAAALRGWTGPILDVPASAG